MNILTFEEQDHQELFDNSNSLDYDIEEQTEELINQVFNRKYEPVYDPKLTKAKQEQYKLLKKMHNKANKPKLAQKQYSHKASAPIIYKKYQPDQVSPSLSQFLLRAQQKVSNHHSWVIKEKKKGDQAERLKLKEVPDILRGSRQKLQPIYQRCIDLQKIKQKKLQNKRIQKSRQQTQTIHRLTFKPAVNGRPRQRAFEQYLAEKQAWQRDKQQQVDRKRVAVQVQRLSECTFSPLLVSQYKKPNKRIIPGQRVQDRLLRSLQKSVDRSLEAE